MQKIIQNIILITTIIIYTIILLFSFFYDSNTYYNDKTLLSIIFSIITLIIWSIIYIFINKKIKNITKKGGVIFLIIYFILVSIIQYVVLKQLSVEPSWDFGVVFADAEHYALNGIRSTSYPEYFQLFPNNIMLFVLFLIFIKLGLIFNIKPLISGYIMNVIFIDIALLLIYLTIKNIKNRKNAIFGLILTFSFLPLFLYTPIIYSDTLSLFIPIMFIYLYSKIEKKEILTKKNIIISIIMGILLFLGKEIKVTSLIIFIAIIIGYILNNFKIKKFVPIIISFIIFLVCELSFKAIIVNNNNFKFKINDSGSIPITHWIMMGVEDVDRDNSNRNSYGGYNELDYITTEKYQTKTEKIKYNVNEYFNRVNKMGVIGYSNYLVHKSINTWTDGYYFSNIKLSLKPKNKDSKLYQLLNVDEKTTSIFRSYTQGVQYALIVTIIIGCILKLKQKNTNLDYIRLTLLGLVIFFLFWENRSRYIFNYIPMFILIIDEFYYIIYDKIVLKEQEKNIII